MVRTGSLGNPPSSSIQLRAGVLGLASFGTDLVLDPGLVQDGLGERSPTIDPGATRCSGNQPSPLSAPALSLSPLPSPQPLRQRGCIMPLMAPMGPKSTDPQLSKPEINPTLTKH